MHLIKWSAANAVGGIPFEHLIREYIQRGTEASNVKVSAAGTPLSFQSRQSARYIIVHRGYTGGYRGGFCAAQHVMKQECFFALSAGTTSEWPLISTRHYTVQ